MDDSELDRRIVLATQAGLPLTVEPFQAIGEALGEQPGRILERFRAMQADGRVRRIAAVPNHYALGYTANGMSVWDVDDEQVDALGEQLGHMDCVTHCYRRPRRLPLWPYNLFAMVHGHTREEVLARVAEIHALLGAACRAHDVLFSTAILKKTGLRIGA
ncbi:MULTISPECIES: Lrp/AsnC family transcriptional regulator [Niveibacterium]|uniref:siroheme decarboxylase n=1 Tax=Niveibacterium microcysteis TaxID=2811415 RepID=A0ABX7M758_9RHOO|nr:MULTISPECIES: Lrp/AsnC family transcriptional regulator [Niveibacterium]QSI77573.1 Lrp/AsnC family transcriptional regulator [Niveibacterium microcysteis]